MGGLLVKNGDCKKQVPYGDDNKKDKRNDNSENNVNYQSRSSAFGEG
jgi:hypothetical protein